jgi:histidine triad (HIT) family protein
MITCVFCKIVARTEPAHVVWESDEHIAFLSIFPNTPGVTVVIPKAHHSSYAFDLDDKKLAKLVVAAKTVGKHLDRTLGVARTGMVLEGFGVDHVHAKLFPLHGTKPGELWQPVTSKIDTYLEKYDGHISSHDGPRASDSQLVELAKKLNGSSKPLDSKSGSRISEE